MKILVFDVGQDRERSVCGWLRQEGHDVQCASDAVEVGLLDMVERFDLVVVARRARKRISGVVSEFWSERVRCPVILLPNDEMEEGEPFSRMRSALATVTISPKKASRVKVGDLVVDLALREAFRAGERIELTRREYDLLEILASNVGRVLSRESIQLAVWGDDYAASNTVDVHIAKLRKKVDDPFGEPLIRTVIGFGYVMRAPEVELAES
ncbi:response regulator transcription factor [bacterium]|nr:MAG: response regulator transcription factor [bacterium]